VDCFRAASGSTAQQSDCDAMGISSILNLLSCPKAQVKLADLKEETLEAKARHSLKGISLVKIPEEETRCESVDFGMFSSTASGEWSEAVTRAASSWAQVPHGDPATKPRRSKTDRIVQRHRRKLMGERLAVVAFLDRNGFQNLQVNGRRGVLGRGPLHEAVRQNSPQMVALLLRFGSSAFLKDYLGRTAYDYAKKSAKKEILMVFNLYGISPHSPRFLKGMSRLQREPPPIGFETFFAKLEQ
ncbi:unnamed protein product, partial [Effrenium voratum]